MKRLAVAAASVLLMLGAAQAQTSPMYGEIGYTVLNVDTGLGDVNPHALRGIIGYDFHPNFAAEGMLAFGIKDDDFSGNFLGTPFTAEVKLRHAFGVFVKPKYNFGNVEAFARLGYVRTKVRVSATTPLGSASDSGSEGDFAYGLGVNYRFNPRMHVGLDYMRYLDKDGGKVDGWTLGFGYRF